MQMTYQELKHDFIQNETTKLLNKYQGFFAFSDKQLAEGIAEKKIDKNEPLASFPGGGIMPKKNIKQFMTEFESLHDKMIEEIKKLDPEPIIRYELGNYESWYTGDISDAFAVLKSYGYSKEQVMKVYAKYAEEAKNW